LPFQSFRNSCSYWIASLPKDLSFKNPPRLSSRNYLIYLLRLRRYAASAFESAASASSAIPAKGGKRPLGSRLIHIRRPMQRATPRKSSAGDEKIWRRGVASQQVHKAGEQPHHAFTSCCTTSGSPAACQASKPPATLITLRCPARSSKLHAIRLRYPLLQCTAVG
jgi:hypothetical protein